MGRKNQNRSKRDRAVKNKEKTQTGDGGSPCDDCIPAKCCMYYSVEMDEPENAKDYDDLLWIIAHRDTEIYATDDRWYLLVHSPCRFYDPEKRCLIYPKRPRICRQHTKAECEFEDDYDFDLHFHNYEELERFIRNNT